MPCITELPPDFLRGSASPHPANNEKRYRLYRLFWQCLNDLNVWSDDEYLAKKERRTDIYDRREIFPECIIHVGSNKNQLYFIIIIQNIGERYPSHDGSYVGYRSTFDAENDDL